ncbi:MAG: ATP-binding cassette domain-containing protein [Chloroflexi bacterium]|nr:ATP-binding cassette domain-containing protein [Chloroflexota bacterium]
MYNGRSVLEIDELTIHSGEILALVGPSGVGKSTLLRLLNFLEPPTQGTVTFRGHPFDGRQEMPPHQSAARHHGVSTAVSAQSFRGSQC